MFNWLTQLMERMQYHKKCHCIIFYCFIWEGMSKPRALCVIAGSKHLYSLMLSSVSWCLEPMMKHSPSFWHFIWKCFLKRKKFTSQIQTGSFRQGNLFPCLVPVRRFPWPSRSIHLVWYPRRTDKTHLLCLNHVTRNALAAWNNEG